MATYGITSQEHGSMGTDINEDTHGSEINSVRICSIPYEVIQSDPGRWADNGMGRASIIDCQITIRKNMPGSAKAVTMIHELLHIILDVNGSDHADDEKLVSTLATGLMTVFRDNPELVRRLVQGRI